MTENPFKLWVKNSGGVGQVSEKLGVKRRTIQYWLEGKVAPNLKSAVLINMLSGKRVSFQNLLDLRK